MSSNMSAPAVVSTMGVDGQAENAQCQQLSWPCVERVSCDEVRVLGLLRPRQVCQWEGSGPRAIQGEDEAYWKQRDIREAC